MLMYIIHTRRNYHKRILGEWPVVRQWIENMGLQRQMEGIMCRRALSKGGRIRSIIFLPGNSGRLILNLRSRSEFSFPPLQSPPATLISQLKFKLLFYKWTYRGSDKTRRVTAHDRFSEKPRKEW